MNMKDGVLNVEMHLSPVELLYLRLRLADLGVWSILDEGFLARRDSLIAVLTIDGPTKARLERVAKHEGLDRSTYLDRLIEVALDDFWSFFRGFLNGAGVRRAIEVHDDADLAIIEDPGGGVSLAGAADGEADQGTPFDDDEEFPF